MSGFLGFSAFGFASYVSIFSYKIYILVILQIMIVLIGVYITWFIPHIAVTVLTAMIFCVMVVYVSASIIER